MADIETADFNMYRKKHYCDIMDWKSFLILNLKVQTPLWIRRYFWNWKFGRSNFWVYNHLEKTLHSMKNLPSISNWPIWYRRYRNSRCWNSQDQNDHLKVPDHSKATFLSSNNVTGNYNHVVIYYQRWWTNSYWFWSSKTQKPVLWGRYFCNLKFGHLKFLLYDHLEKSSLS